MFENAQPKRIDATLRSSTRQKDRRARKISKGGDWENNKRNNNNATFLMMGTRQRHTNRKYFFVLPSS